MRGSESRLDPQLGEVMMLQPHRKKTQQWQQNQLQRKRLWFQLSRQEFELQQLREQRLQLLPGLVV